MRVAEKHFWLSGVWKPPAVETITANSYPMQYLPLPLKAMELASKVENATIISIALDYPLKLIKKGKAQELRSKFQSS
jgi:hypothetical protein